MLMFLLLFLPLFLAVYCFKVRAKRIIPVILIGFLTAVLVVVFKMLFMLSHRVVYYSFASNIIYCLIKESLLPVIVLYGLFFLISKDNVEFKINVYIPLLLAFYSVYLPYCVISTTSSAYSIYSLFVKPVVFGIMIAQSGVSLRDLYRSVISKKIILVILNVFLILMYMTIPAVLDAVYCMNYNMFIYVGILVVYLVLSIFMFLVNKKVILDKE